MENNKETPDLDHLKAVWNQDLQRLSDSAEFINRQNLSAMMHQRTHSAIARLKRNLLIEIVSTALMLAAFIAYTLWIGRPVSWYVWAAIILVTFTGHVLLYGSLRRQDQMLESKLTEALDTSIRHTGRFVRSFKQSALIIALVIFFIGFNMSFALYDDRTKVWIGVLYSVLAAVGEFSLAQLYIQKLYGRHHEKLLACRAELNQE